MFKMKIMKINTIVFVTIVFQLIVIGCKDDSDEIRMICYDYLKRNKAVSYGCYHDLPSEAYSELHSKLLFIFLLNKGQSLLTF